MSKIVVMQDKPLCSPEHSCPAGGTIELPNKLADALIADRAAKPYIDPQAAAKAAAKAKKAAIKALESTLKADLAAVSTKLKSDSNKPGAVKATLEDAARVESERLTLEASEAIATL